MAAAVLAASAAWAIAAPPVAAQEGSPEPSEEVGDTPEPVLGEPVCTLTDPRLTEVSGLVATDDGYIAVNDSQDFVDRKPIFLLDSACNVVDQIPFPTPPLDPEDLALDRERQILWVGDVGDNVAGGLATGGSTRPTVALWIQPPVWFSRRPAAPGSSSAPHHRTDRRHRGLYHFPVTLQAVPGRTPPGPTGTISALSIASGGSSDAFPDGTKVVRSVPVRRRGDSSRPSEGRASCFAPRSPGLLDGTHFSISDARRPVVSRRAHHPHTPVDLARTHHERHPRKAAVVRSCQLDKAMLAIVVGV